MGKLFQLLLRIWLGTSGIHSGKKEQYSQKLYITTRYKVLYASVEFTTEKCLKVMFQSLWVHSTSLLLIKATPFFRFPCKPKQKDADALRIT